MRILRLPALWRGFAWAAMTCLRKPSADAIIRAFSIFSNSIVHWHSWFFYDNSGEYPRLVAYGERDQEFLVNDSAIWHNIKKAMTVKEKQRDKIAEAFSNPETITRALSQAFEMLY